MSCVGSIRWMRLCIVRVIRVRVRVFVLLCTTIQAACCSCPPCCCIVAGAVVCVLCCCVMLLLCYCGRIYYWAVVFVRHTHTDRHTDRHTDTLSAAHTDAATDNNPKTGQISRKISMSHFAEKDTHDGTPCWVPRILMTILGSGLVVCVCVRGVRVCVTNCHSNRSSNDLASGSRRKNR